MIMNKRFSTLLATALVAGGLSFNAMAADIATTDLKDGQFIHLSTTTGGTTYLTMDDKGGFSTVAATSWSGNIDKLLGSLWQVKLIPHTTQAGTTYTYSLTNRLSGQLLSVKLQSDVDGGGRSANITANEKGGNTEWAYVSGNGLYAVKGDSIFTIGTSGDALSFAAEKTTTAPENLTLYMGAVSDGKVTLKANDFNTLVKANAGRLFFTDENVSSTEKNVLTDNKWEAIDAKIKNDGSAFSGDVDVLYLTNGKEHKRVIAPATEETVQKEYLLVDYNFYDPSKDFNKLIVDTIAVEPNAASPAFDTRLAAKHHSATAAFTVTYFIPNDSMVIAPAYVQTSIPVATTLKAMHTALPTEGVITDVKTAVNTLETSVALFYTTYSSGSMPAKGDKFVEANFAANGAWQASAGSSSTGEELIEAVKTAIKGITYSTIAATKKQEEAYRAKVDELKKKYMK